MMTSVVARKHSKYGRHRRVSVTVNLFVGESSGITSNIWSLNILRQASLVGVVSAVSRIGRRYSCSSCQRFICNLHRRDEIIQGDQKASVHLMITIQSSGAQRLFDHSV